MEEQTKSTKRDLTQFQSAISRMVGVNDRSYGSFNMANYLDSARVRSYTPREIIDIIDKGSIDEKRNLSRNFYSIDGIYRRIIIYYATILKYMGILIPHFTTENQTKIAKKAYGEAVNYLEAMKIPTFCADTVLRTLIDGQFFGVTSKNSEDKFGIISLPFEYCRSVFKDTDNNNSIDFNMTYFDRMTDEERDVSFSFYPEFFKRSYNKVKKLSNKWVEVPTEISLYLSFSNRGPLFLNTLKATSNYVEYTELEKLKDVEEIKKILIQKIPHNSNTDSLLFEPDEAESMHDGTVKMMKTNRNFSVLTTYADVDVVGTDGNNESIKKSNLDKILQTIYSEAGVSPQLFATSGNLALEKSILNDIAMMMFITQKIGVFITNHINFKFSGKGISFKYTFFPISYYNEKDFYTASKDLASLGYSFIIPALAQGVSQRDLVDIKVLENDILGLETKLKPLQSAYTQSGGGTGGRPQKTEDSKSERTIANEQSKDDGGGE